MKLLFVVFHFTLCIAAKGLKVPKAKIEARASTWKSLGCYIDNVSGRALPNGEAVPGGANAMTNELCQAACLSAGFSFAGTEYGQECCKTTCPVHFRAKRAEKDQGVVIMSSTVAARHQMEMLAATLSAKATQQRHVEVPIDWTFTNTLRRHLSQPLQPRPLHPFQQLLLHQCSTRQSVAFSTMPIIQKEMQSGQTTLSVIRRLDGVTATATILSAWIQA